MPIWDSWNRLLLNQAAGPSRGDVGGMAVVYKGRDMDILSLLPTFFRALTHESSYSAPNFVSPGVRSDIQFALIQGPSSPGVNWSIQVHTFGARLQAALTSFYGELAAEQGDTG